ncbi:MAG: protein-glutamate O-methyltransferase CheR [Sedimentisphaerales bacterium]|nr:protein-glutamate O-methyltransferase CheR [Sedimentisphaerales bacterium]
MTDLRPGEFAIWASYIQRLCGIKLDPTKEYLLQTRLAPLVRQAGCNDLNELYHKTVTDPTGQLAKQVVEAMTTKETYWFRDGGPFEVLGQVILPELVKARAGQGTIRIWSAACSTGQEVYSIAMVAKQTMQCHPGIEIRILGTDISDQAIATASYGRYTDFEVGRGLPKEMLNIYFNRDGAGWRIRDALRAMVYFRKQNLLEPFLGLGRFDIVFCRNVAIYFSPEDRRSLFNRIADVLNRPGYLIIGGSEYLTGICDRFEPRRLGRGVYYVLASPLAASTTIEHQPQTCVNACT